MPNTPQGLKPPQDPHDTSAWMAYSEAANPGRVELPDATERERREWNRRVRVYRMVPAVRRHIARSRGEGLPRPRGAGRPAGRRTRHVAQCTSSSDPGEPGEQPAVPLRLAPRRATWTTRS